MTLEKIQKDMLAALKSGDKTRKLVLSNLAAAIKKAAIDKKIKDNISEDLVNEVILKEKKTVQEMIDTCPNEREDLRKEYSLQMAIITEYAPRILDDENDIRIYIHEVMETLETPNMKTIMPLLKGKVNMKIANQILKEIL